MSRAAASEQRTCPGENYAISLAICRTRQRNQYPKCLLCPHRDPQIAGSTATDPKVAMSLFRSTGVLGRVPQELNEYVVRKVGLAAVQFLRAESPSASRFVVACDLRGSSRAFARIFCEGVNRGGADAYNIGPASAELAAFMVGTDGYLGAAFIGGRNYPENVNGIRLWRGDLSPVGFGTGLEKIGLIARRLRAGQSRMAGSLSAVDPMGDYVAYVRKLAPRLRPLRIVVDAGGGCATRAVSAVLAGLPLQVTMTHPGQGGAGPHLGRRFPCEELRSELGAQVRRLGADCAAAVDFDGERIAFFDENGELLEHDVAAGLIAAELLARSPEASVTYDLRASAALGEWVQERGGRPVPGPTTPLAFAVHFRRTDALYGADLTGFHYFKDFFRFPSPVIALLAFCSYLSREGKPVSELASELRRYVRSGEIKVPLASADVAREVLAKLRDEFKDAECDKIDGLSVRLDNWWFHVRQHGETGELRLNVEGRTARDLRRGRQALERIVSQVAASAGS